MSPPSHLGSTETPDDPTVAQIAEVFGESYTPLGVVRVLHASQALVSTREGRRELYGRALALAEGVFS